MINKFDEFLNEKYYDDLTPYQYDHDRGYKNVVNIGWLDKNKDFNQGDVPQEFISKLNDLEVVTSHKGFHNCPFCDNSRSSTILMAKGKGVNYFCPGMIKHYVTKHNYLPPQEFIDAVMKTTDKKEVKKEVSRNDSNRLMKRYKK